MKIFSGYEFTYDWNLPYALSPVNGIHCTIAILLYENVLSIIFKFNSFLHRHIFILSFMVVGLVWSTHSHILMLIAITVSNSLRNTLLSICQSLYCIEMPYKGTERKVEMQAKSLRISHRCLQLRRYDFCTSIYMISSKTFQLIRVLFRIHNIYPSLKAASTSTVTGEYPI